MEDPLLPKKSEIESSSGSRRSLIININGDFSSPNILNNTEISTVLTNPNASSYANLITNLNKKQKLSRRWHSAPSIFTDMRERFQNPQCSKPSSGNRALVRQAFCAFLVYAITGVVIYTTTGSYKGHTTVKPVDALYYIVVTLCTIGYGDIVPSSTFAKLFTCFFILVGFGFIDTVLNALVLYICDRQEEVLLTAMDENRFNKMVETYVMDKEKGRMRIRMKVFLALTVVVCCIAIGAIGVHFLEELSWVDSFYMSVTSVTTVGYGDYSFTTLKGRVFAIIWLLVSTLAVARAFLYLAELRMDKRSRSTAKWFLQRKVTVMDLVAADLDNDGSISKSEFVIYKLKEMGKVAENDIQQICRQFDSMEHSNQGKITLADIMAHE